MPLATFGQIYGASAPGDGGTIEAITPGAAEQASTFKQTDYPAMDKAPALAWLALVLAVVVIRIASND